MQPRRLSQQAALTMPFTLSDGNRFDGDFAVAAAPGYTPTPQESTFVDKISAVVDDLAADVADDPADPDGAPSALAVARRQQRKQAASELRAQAEAVNNGQILPLTVADNVLVIKGKYRCELEHLSGSLFVVGEKTDPNSQLSVDLSIRVASGLPPPNDIPSPDKQELFVALNSAATVIKAVCQRLHQRADNWWKPDAVSKSEHKRAGELLDQYIKKLAGIGRLGLEDQNTPLAKLALNGLRAEFVAQQAGRIKNAYIRSLGLAAGGAALLFLVLYVLVVTESIRSAWWQLHKTFLLAAMGGAVGTWLSFSIRRVQLSFDDLAMLEEDLLDPGARVVFVVGLTLAACLLFWTGAINLEIGDLKTRPPSFAATGSIGLLVGVFCGLSERALATALSGRAATFVKGIAGGT